MILERSWWDGPELHIKTDDGHLDWTAGRRVHWTVGPVVRPRDTPMYVFEPRPVERIARDLESATTDDARNRLEAERRLCDRPHVVYVAFYGTLPKVGMTQEDRVLDRLREQGADAGFIVARTADRAAARDVENAVSFRYRIPQWRTHKELLPQWTRAVDMDRIRPRADDLRRRLGPDYEPEDLQVISDHPLPILPSRPHKVAAEGVHAGTIVGAKGNFLVYEAAPDPQRLAVGQPRLVAVKRADLDGRSVDVGAT